MLEKRTEQKEEGVRKNFTTSTRTSSTMMKKNECARSALGEKKQMKKNLNEIPFGYFRTTQIVKIWIEGFKSF